VLEDIHWAEPTLLDVIEHIVEWTEDAPLLILCLARPEFLDERPGWIGTRLELEPLPEDQSERIVSTLAPNLDAAARTRAAEAAEGNPLFLEQLIALAAEDGDELPLPHTIQAVLAARLDRLEADERALLEAAAVVGKEFWRSALLDLSPPGTEVSALLQRLMRKRLIAREPSAFPGEDAFRFAHILVREAAYSAIAKEARAELHEGFADWLERGESPYDEIIGYHLEQAHLYRAQLQPPDEGLRVLGERAGRRLAQAGRRALTRGDPASAVNLFERARPLLRDSPEKFSMSVELAQGMRGVGDLEGANLLLGETIAQARARGDERTEWLATLAEASLGEQLDPESWMPRLRVTAERAREVFEALADDSGLARAEGLLGQSLWNGGHYDEAAAHYRRALAHARRAGDEPQELLMLSALLASMYYGTTRVHELRCETEAYVARVQGSPGWRYRGVLMFACLSAMEGAAEDARSYYLEAKQLAEELGLKTASATQFAEEVGLLSGDAAFAERELRAGYLQLEEAGERGGRSTVAALLAEALYLLGRHAESERFADLALELTSPEDIASQARGRGVKAKLLATRKEYERAERLAREAVELFAHTDDLFQQSQVLMILADVLEAAERNEEAIPVLESAVEVSERKGNVVTAERARARVAALTAATRV
jgi:tetratricopeptide (TPR) repeat protein